MTNYGFNIFHRESQLEKNNENEEFIVINCGYFIANKSPHLYCCQEKNYLLLYMNSGTATINDNGKQYTLKAGSVFIYTEKTTNNIVFNSDEKNERYYIFFNGTRVKEYLSDLNLQCGTVYNIGYYPGFIESVKLLIADFRTHGFNNKRYKSIILLNVLAQISHKSNEKVLNKKYTIIQSAIDNMNQNFREPILKNVEYARMCDISVSTLINTFKEYTGFTPKKYFFSLKIEYAMSQIINTTKTINQIAYELKFEDPLYFSRVFKKFTNFYPTEYREKFNS